VSTPAATVVVPTVDRVALLRRTLAGLRAQRRGDVEIIVVHDGDPGVVELLASCDDQRVRAMQIGDRSATAKRNAGWRASSAPVIAFTDDDCEPSPEWLAELLPAFDDPTVDIVQGPTLPHPADAHVTGIFRRTIDVREHTDTYPCANVAYRRDALERVDGFDPAFWGGGEDTDLAWRVRESGGLVAFADRALVHHAVRPADLVEHLRSLPRWQTLALVVKRHPQLRSRLRHRLFWKASHPTALLAVAAVVAAAASRRPRLLLLITPLLARRVREAGLRSGVQLAIADVAEVGVVLAGSARYRTILL
jgi:GT2 family glycosyltransferase